MASAWIVKKGRRADGTWTRHGLSGRRRAHGAGAPAREVLRDVRWEVRYRRGGRGARAQTFATFDTKTRAEAAVRLVDDALAAGRDPRAEATVGPDLATAMAELRAAKAHRSPHTLKNFDRSVAIMGDLARVALADLTPAHLEAWSRAQRHLRRSTQRIHVSNYARAIARHRIDPNPAKDRHIEWCSSDTDSKSRAPDHQGRSWAPPFSQIALIDAALEHPRRRSRPSPYLWAWRFLLATGLREVEAIHIRCGDVEQAAGRIWIPRTKGQTGGRRWIPITSELQPVIEALDPRGRPAEERLVVITGSDGRRRPMTGHGIYMALLRASVAAGTIRRVRPNDLRHRQISRLIAAHVPLPVVRQLVGHTNLTSLFRVYSHPMPGEPLEPLEVLCADVMRFIDEGRDQPAGGPRRSR